jgi:hypothetical protein
MRTESLSAPSVIVSVVIVPPRPSQESLPAPPVKLRVPEVVAVLVKLSSPSSPMKETLVELP